MIVQSFLACLLLCSWNAFSYNLHVKSREISHSLNSIRHRCKEFDTDREAGSDIWSELVKIDPMNYSDVNTELNSKNNKSANEERIESLKYNLEMETYKDESKVYLDEKSNTEEIVYSWNNIDMEKEAIVSYVQGVFPPTILLIGA